MRQRALHPFCKSGWQWLWTLSPDGRRAVHKSGLVVARVGGCAKADPETAQQLAARLARERGGMRHVGAEIHRLITEAERLLVRKRRMA